MSNALRQDLSVGINSFELLTLTLEFDLLLENFNFAYNFRTVSARASIFHTTSPCDKTFGGTIFFNFVTFDKNVS